jgi:hypothetical protein
LVDVAWWHLREAHSDAAVSFLLDDFKLACHVVYMLPAPKEAAKSLIRDRVEAGALLETPSRADMAAKQPEAEMGAPAKKPNGFWVYEVQTVAPNVLGLDTMGCGVLQISAGGAIQDARYKGDGSTRAVQTRLPFRAPKFGFPRAEVQDNHESLNPPSWADPE